MINARTRRSTLKDRVALVTGAARGIGRATAFALARAGAEVALLDADATSARAVASEIGRTTGRRAIAVRADVTMLGEVRRAVRRVVTMLGRLDLLVNNAGIWEYGNLAEVKETDWDRIFSVNLKGTLFCTQAAVAIMRRQAEGKILNIASAAGLQPVPSWTAYCISKAAAVMLSRVAAEELKADNIQVHCLCPGAVDTDLARRITELTGERFPHAMDPDQVAEAVVDLLTPFGSTRTGRIVVMYGTVREELNW